MDEARVARTWADAYGHLVEFESHILGEMLEMRNQAPIEVRPMIHTSNLEPMRELIAEFEARRQKWLDRLADLQPPPSDSAEPS